MVHVAGRYSAAVAVSGLLCWDIFWKVVPLHDFVTFTYDAIFLFATILNILVKR